MLNHSLPISFLATANSAQSRYFFETILSLPCTADEPYALVFELGSSVLRIQKVETVHAVDYTVLGWQVENIRECVDKLTKKGVQFENFTQLVQDELNIWKSPSGASVAWFKDPDGNTLSLTQLHTSSC